MNVTTVQIAKYAGVGLAGIATSCMLGAPAIAMQPPDQQPAPGSAPPHRIFDSLDGRNGPAASPPTNPGPTTDGVDWATLATVLGSGAVLSGAVVLGTTQIRRRHAHPA